MEINLSAFILVGIISVSNPSRIARDFPRLVFSPTAIATILPSPLITLDPANSTGEGSSLGLAIFDLPSFLSWFLLHRHSDMVPLNCGNGSPLTSASSHSIPLPANSTPSAGTFFPGCSMMISPVTTSCAGISLLIPPRTTTHRAGGGGGLTAFLHRSLLYQANFCNTEDKNNRMIVVAH